MNLHHAYASQTHTEEVASRPLPNNTPQDKVANLILNTDEVAEYLSSSVDKLNNLEELTLTLLDVTDPERRGIAQLARFVGASHALRKLSLENVFLLNPDQSSTLERRERVVDAFLKSAITNLSIQSVSMNCCRYSVSRLAELISRPMLKHLSLANCRSLEDLKQPENAATLLQAFSSSHQLEALWLRRSVEPIEADVLLHLGQRPLLSHLGLSVCNVPTALAFQKHIESAFSSSHNPHVFCLAGARLDSETMGPLIQGFLTRQYPFHLELRGCQWDTQNHQTVFLQQIMLSRHLSSLYIDKDCWILDDPYPSRMQQLEEIVPLQFRLFAIISDASSSSALVCERNDPSALLSGQSLSALLIQRVAVSSFVSSIPSSANKRARDSSVLSYCQTRAWHLSDHLRMSLRISEDGEEDKDVD